MRSRFILIETSHAGNVGATARAMKVMGFDDLVLVRPRWPNVLRRKECIERASGAQDVLEKARVVEHLDEAVQGMTHLCATVMVPRDFGPPTRHPRVHFHDLLATDPGLQADWGVAFLFGCERYGMNNEDVYRCHAALSIPTRADFGSLNLAAAVQLIAYDWRQALAARGEEGSWAVQAPATAQVSATADAAEIGGLLGHWAQALQDLGFLDPAAPKKLMPRINQILNRACLTHQEVQLLRGIARSVQRMAVQAHAPDKNLETRHKT